ncbi:hypothetical protein [Alteromonas lipotrueae]|uniref:hypothetical protein n=1 Tax=Alteromonas lipotrueae TaxID=2803814 RepID=UPI00215C38B0|nr:hypothetical protein [Alteromonas lipotrueae]
MYQKFFCLLFLLSSNLCAEDLVVEVPANPEKGFFFPFFLKVPELTETNYLIVETNNTGKVSDDFDIHLNSARKAILGNSIGPWVSKKLKAPILVPAFPRSEKHWETYTHAFDSDTMLVDSGKLKRIDLQLLAMINEAKSILRTHSVIVNERIVMTGFSASGTFANRFSLLHPESLKVVVAGGLNGILMLPVNSLNEVKLDYPLGLNNFEQVTGKAFAKEKWKALPQFLFMGENDTNDSTKFGDAYSDEEKATIYSSLGESMQPNRWENCQNKYLKHGANAVLKTYENIGHGTDLRIHNDILAFISENI